VRVDGEGSERSPVRVEERRHEAAGRDAENAVRLHEPGHRTVRRYLLDSGLGARAGVGRPAEAAVVYRADRQQQERAAGGGHAGRLPVLRPRPQVLGAVPTRLQRLPRRPRRLHDSVHHLRDADYGVPRQPVQPAADPQLVEDGRLAGVSSGHGAALRTVSAVAGRRHPPGTARHRRVLLPGLLRAPEGEHPRRRCSRSRETDQEAWASAQVDGVGPSPHVRLPVLVEYLGAGVQRQRYCMVNANTFNLLYSYFNSLSHGVILHQCWSVFAYTIIDYLPYLP